MIVGRVVRIVLYPVKSMSGVALEEVDVGWNGLDGDRRWAFVRPGQERNGFPWLTLRERADLSHYRPDHEGRVRTPTGQTFDVSDPALAAELGDSVRVIKQDRGVFDTLPISLLSRQTLGEHDIRRYRPNLLVDSPGSEYPEDAWVGETLRIGGARIRIDKRDGRCVVVNIDPVTGARDPSVLRFIAKARQGMFGVYATTVTPGRIRVGDEIES